MSDQTVKAVNLPGPIVGGTAQERVALKSTAIDNFLTSANENNLREAYRHHSATCRAWLVAFGVGLPIFLASNDKVWNAFSGTPGARGTLYLYLVAVAIQVCVSLVDKYAGWFCLSAIWKLRATDSFTAKVGYLWIEKDWPSFLADLISIALFAYATWRVVQVLP